MAAPNLWTMADLATPMAIRVAATLRVAEHIAQGLTTSTELARATDTDEHALERVLQHLATVDVFGCDGAGHYSLTAHGEALANERVRDNLDIESALGRAELSFVQLLHTVRTGEPAFRAQYGTDFWVDIAADPNRAASFDAQMGADVAAWAPAIVDPYDWSRHRHVADVGGGNGTLLIALLNAFPELRGTVVDLPGPTTRAHAAIAAAGLADRAEAKPGSFFEPLPTDADAYLLTAILHDWDDERATAILRQCARAAGTHGTILVVEKIGTDGATPNTNMDLRLLAYMGGKERSRHTLVALTEHAGLRLVATHEAGAIVILELRADEDA